MSSLDSSKSFINFYNNYTNFLNDLPEGGIFYTNNKRVLLQKNMVLNSKKDGRLLNFYYYFNQLSSNSIFENKTQNWFSIETKHPVNDLSSLNSTILGKKKNVNWFTNNHQEKANINMVPWFLCEDLVRPSFKIRNWY